MADKIAVKMGKSILKKKLAGHGIQDKQANNSKADTSSFYHYTVVDEHGRKLQKTKTVKYFIAQGIPKDDAKILISVMRRARKLDTGFRFCGAKIGWSTIIGLAIPVAGAFVDAGLSWLFVIRKAEQISGGKDKRDMTVRIYGNLGLGLLIGLTPYIGEIVDTVLRFNIRDAIALEDLLLKRARNAEKIDGGMNGVVPVAARDQTRARAQYEAHPVPRLPTRDTADSTRKVLSNDDEKYGDMHRRIATKSAKAPAREPERTKSGWSVFGKRDAQESHMRKKMSGEGRQQVAPLPPPRPADSRRGDGWF